MASKSDFFAYSLVLRNRIDDIWELAEISGKHPFGKKPLLKPAEKQGSSNQPQSPSSTPTQISGDVPIRNAHVFPGRPVAQPQPVTIPPQTQ